MNSTSSQPQYSFGAVPSVTYLKLQMDNPNDRSILISTSGLSIINHADSIVVVVNYNAVNYNGTALSSQPFKAYRRIKEQFYLLLMVVSKVSATILNS
jgi:hypothetical protein